MKSIPLLLFLTAWTAALAQVDQHVAAGIASLKTSDLAGAEAEFAEATKQNPGNVEAWLLLAQTEGKLKKHDAALEAARKAEVLGAGNPDVLQALANMYSGVLQDPVKAADLGKRYAERKPQDKTAWRRLTAYCLSTGQAERAIEAGIIGLKTDDSPELHDLLGQAYSDRRQWMEARAQFAEAVKASPYDADLHFHLARVYLVQQDFPGAIQVLENARRYFDKSPQIELALGVADYGQRDFAKAIDQFLYTIRLAPDVPQPYVFLGRLLDHVGDRLNQVTARFAAYQAQNPKDPLGYVLHAKALLAQLPAGGDPQNVQPALDLLQQALALKENDAEAQYLAGLVLVRQGEFAKAAAHLERSIALDAGDPAPHYQLARAYARLGRKEDSERERALHEKLSNEVNGADPLGLTREMPRPSAAPPGK
ncbi:MAG TPA: tetratricopeptide repeat protein [Bryobacteraceae bacterium]|nr:tetratricopeptide repeat protein [Bryobacteraceae bacterium]